MTWNDPNIVLIWSWTIWNLIWIWTTINLKITQGWETWKLIIIWDDLELKHEHGPEWWPEANQPDPSDCHITYKDKLLLKNLVTVGSEWITSPDYNIKTDTRKTCYWINYDFWSTNYKLKGLSRKKRQFPHHNPTCKGDYEVLCFYLTGPGSTSTFLLLCSIVHKIWRDVNLLTQLKQEGRERLYHVPISFSECQLCEVLRFRSKLKALLLKPSRAVLFCQNQSRQDCVNR